MTLFTDGLIVRPGRNILDDVATGQLDAAEAAFDQALFENPTTALRRINELRTAEEGQIVQQAHPAYNVPEVRAEPETPLLTPEEARKRVADSGLDITVDNTGIREGALNILLERKRAERERQVVLQNAPSSTVPIQIAAGFAASAIDPINIASAFIPVVGEARYAAALGRATTTAGRFAARARLGAVEGAVGAAVVEPLVLYASAQDQSDYDLTDSLANIAFGGVLGGGLHGAGGFISDLRKTRVLDDVVKEVSTAPDGTTVPRRAPYELALQRGDDDPMLVLRESLDKAVEADRPRIAEAASRQATEELLPTFRAELEEVTAGRLVNVADLKAEQAGIAKRIEALDETFQVRAKEFQSQRMSRKQAEQAARNAIAEERKSLSERDAEIAGALDTNRQAELARADLGRMSRGEIPERFNQRIAERSGKIASGFELRDTARIRAEAAPWQVRQNALKAAVSQAVTGRPIDVEAIFDLADPIKRADAMASLKKPAQRAVDQEAELSSRTVDESVQADRPVDLEQAEKALADELELTQEMADQAGLDLAPFLKEADEQIADAETYAAAYRAAALCQLRN